MEDKKDNRSQWLHVRLTKEEQQRLQKAWKNTTEAKLSEYVRKIILGKPMIAGVRDQSLQDIFTELSNLRRDLNGTANNFNQAVKKLHTWPRERNLETWLLTFRIDEKNLLRSISEIKSFINQTAEKWLRG